MTRLILLYLVSVSALSSYAEAIYGSEVGVPKESLVRSLNEPVAADGPTLIFKLFSLPSFSNSYYRIEVWSGDGSIKLQEIGEIRNGIEVHEHEDRFRVEDLNSDGYADISLLGGIDKSGKVEKRWYKVWMYQPTAKSFVFQASM